MSILRQHDVISAVELARMLTGVSAVTIPRDIVALADAGALRRTRGGAMLPASTLSVESAIGPLLGSENVYDGQRPAMANLNEQRQHEWSCYHRSVVEAQMRFSAGLVDIANWCLPNQRYAKVVCILAQTTFRQAMIWACKPVQIYAPLMHGPARHAKPVARSVGLISRSCW